MNLKQTLTQKFKGSVLAYSMIILFVMLSIVLTMSAVSITERNNASTTGKSVQAFQTANSGAELFMKALKANLANPVNTLAGSLGSGFSCITVNGVKVISGNIASQGNVTIQLLNAGGTTIDCASAATPTSTIAQIKSTGNFSGAARAIAINVAMAQAAAGPIICDSGAFGNGIASGSYTYTFTAADCGGTLPDATYVGVASTVNIPGGLQTFNVLSGANPGVNVYANGWGSNQRRFKAVYFKM